MAVTVLTRYVCIHLDKQYAFFYFRDTKMIKEIAALTTILALSGCAVVSSPVGNGTLFTSTKGPITATDF